MRYAATPAESDCGDALGAHQPPGGVIRVGKRAVVQQVAPIIPGVGHAIHAGQAVGGVILVGDGALGGGHCGAVAHSVVDKTEAG